MLPSLNVNYSSVFLLTNSAIGVDGRLRFLEFYASKPGSIEISVSKVSASGLISDRVSENCVFRSDF